MEKNPPIGFYLATYLPAALLLVLAFFLSKAIDVPFSMLTRDTAASGALPFVAGWVSYLGAVMWAAAAAIALFTAAHARDGRLLGGLGVLSLLLLGDDLFMMHDGLLEHAGIDERIPLAFYGLLLALIIRSHAGFLVAHGLPLVVAMLFLAGSIAVDLLPDDWFPVAHHLLEDGTKFLGIAGWLGNVIFLAHMELGGARRAP